jgi:hypothetical protein
MKKISEINAGGLEYISGKLKVLKNLEEKVCLYLPQEIRAFCRVANIENGVLKFAVPSGVWGNRARYIFPDLLKSLRKSPGLSHLTEITCYVEPEFDKLFG